ncbi:MAG TPA: hypothetical protein VGN51_00810 [Acidimicrobiia bacterium]
MTAQPAEPADNIERLRARYVAALDDVQGAGDRAMEVLVAVRAARQLTRDHVARGRPVIELENVIEPQVLRASLGDTLAAFERARHDAQRLLFQLMHAEGNTLADIGRAYGISRQLVSRMVNEPDPTLT